MALTAAFELTNASCRPPTVVNNCLNGHNDIRVGSTYNEHATLELREVFGYKALAVDSAACTLAHA